MESNKGKLAGNIAAIALVLGTATAAVASAASNMDSFPLDAPSPTATPEATPSSIRETLEKKITPKAAPVTSAPVEIIKPTQEQIEKKATPKPVVKTTKPSPKPEPKVEPVSYSYSKSDLKNWAKNAVGASQFSCLNTLWEHESGWNYKATNRSSGAYGIPQSLPGSKMASAGADWRTNPYTQMKWGLSYIKSRYGTPCGAYDHFKRKNWY